MDVGLTITDALVVKVLSPAEILIAIGNTVHHYFIKNEIQTVRLIQLPFENLIYGIECYHNFDESAERLVAIYGGHQCCLYALDNKQIHRLLLQQDVNDWICSVQLFNSNSFCIYTYQNSALHMVRYDKKYWKLDKRKICEEHSTIYSSKLCGDSWNALTVFAGTALGELFLWHPSVSDKVLLRRLLHNGVIFCIDVEPKFNLLITSSDDRSVKVWEISDKLFCCDSNDKTYSELSDSQMQRITNNEIQPEPSNLNTLKNLRSCFGHKSRVFRCKIITLNNQPHIITLGEDSFLCVWNLAGNILVKRRHHFGASIWGVDYEPCTKTIYSTANDGSFMDYKLSDIAMQFTELPISRCFSKLQYLDNGMRVIVTRDNNFLVEMHRTDEVSVGDNFALIANDNEFNVTCIEAHGKEWIVGGYQQVIGFKWSESCDQRSQIIKFKHKFDFMGVIRSIFFLSDEFYLASDAETFLCFNYDRSVCVQFKPLDYNGSFVTCGILHNNTLLIGDRGGRLHLFKFIPKLSFEDAKEVIGVEIIHQKTLRIRNTSYGITSILFLKNSFKHDKLFLISLHENCLKTIEVKNDASDLLEKSSQKVPINWISNTFIVNNERYVIGFNDKHIVVWNYHDDVVFLHDCGGGHRQWDIFVDKQTGLCELTYIQVDVLKQHKFALKRRKLQPMLINYKWHTSSCNALKQLKLSNGNMLIVSGSDDNLLKFHIYETEKGVLSYLCEIYQHVSNIRAIDVRKTDALDQWIIFSSGGRAQICVTQITLKSETNEYELYELCNFMLKSTDSVRVRAGKAQTIGYEAETRFMSMCVVPGCNQLEFVLYVGCSDGYVRIFKFKNFIITEVGSFNYGKCILNVHFLPSHSILLVMSTDGMITIMFVNEEFHCTMASQIKTHLSGINCWDILEIGSGIIDIATGGDDENVTLTRMHLDTANKNVVTLNVLKQMHYHIAPVNGVKFNKDGTLWTSGLDQRLIQFNIEDSKQLLNKFACVADIKGLEITDEGFVLVYGAGFQSFHPR